MNNERGFTLIEVVIALTLLLVVMVGLVTMTGKTTNVAATGDRQEAAVQLASDRIDQVRSDPDYAGLDTTYGKTENSFPTLPGFTRTTLLVRTTAGSQDFKRVTVTVSGPGVNPAVTRTVTVAAP
ncbi:MAG TPA: prepilin-type N-terminal cleavage/methylation domain-containing protein [Gemmatimonadales bacterium]|nr:prepilin-type N-terminal cleavage/methylation domain-containing protein [Gemmatimonadales bacterium]